MKDLLYLPDVVSLRLCSDTCNGCGMCVIVCPRDVFGLSGGKAHIMNRDKCMECGACALNCKPGALKVNSGVGCASGIITGYIRNTEPVCGCSEADTKCC